MTSKDKCSMEHILGNTVLGAHIPEYTLLQTSGSHTESDRRWAWPPATPWYYEKFSLLWKCLWLVFIMFSPNTYSVVTRLTCYPDLLFGCDEEAEFGLSQVPGSLWPCYLMSHLAEEPIGNNLSFSSNRRDDGVWFFKGPLFTNKNMVLHPMSAELPILKKSLAMRETGVETTGDSSAPVTTPAKQLQQYLPDSGSASSVNETAHED